MRVAGGQHVGDERNRLEARGGVGMDGNDFVLPVHLAFAVEGSRHLARLARGDGLLGPAGGGAAAGGRYVADNERRGTGIGEGKGITYFLALADVAEVVRLFRECQHGACNRYGGRARLQGVNGVLGSRGPA